MDAFFGNADMGFLILLGVLCNGIALVLGIVGLITCKDPKAKHNAQTATYVGGIITVVGVLVRLYIAMTQH
jgi:hypothetical protein